MLQCLHSCTSWDPVRSPDDLLTLCNLWIFISQLNFLTQPLHLVSTQIKTKNQSFCCVDHHKVHLVAVQASKCNHQLSWSCECSHFNFSDHFVASMFDWKHRFGSSRTAAEWTDVVTELDWAVILSFKANNGWEVFKVISEDGLLREWTDSAHTW